MTLESDIARYSQLREATVQGSQGLTETQSQAQETLNAIRDRIKAGETTGDKIRDHVILNVGFNEELEQRLRIIEADLKSHEGQFVLAVSRRWRQTSYHSPRAHNFIETTADIGIISPPFIQFDIGGISTQAHTSAQKLDKSIWRSDGPIIPLYKGIYAINKPLGKDPDNKTYFGSDSDKEEELPSLEVIIGDEAVTNWFINEANFGFMPQYAREFINRNPQHTLSQEYRTSHFDPRVLVKYYKMQRVLGRQIDPETPGYEQIEEEVNNRKKAILESILSRGDNKQYLTNSLKEAQQLGMTEDPKVIESPVRPGVTRIVDVPKLIQGYIEESSQVPKNSQP